MEQHSVQEIAYFGSEKADGSMIVSVFTHLSYFTKTLAFKD